MTQQASPRRGALDLLRETLRQFLADRILVMSASLSYCAALSLAPLVILTLGVLGLVLDREQVQQHLVTQIESLLGPDSGRLITQVAEHEGGADRSLAGTLLGLAMLLFGASTVFVQLQDGLNIIWDVEPRPGRSLVTFLRHRLVSLAMVASLGFLLLVSLLASAALSALTAHLSRLTGAEATLAVVLHVLVSVGGCALLLALLFRHVPDARTAWRDVWLGAAVTAILFNLGEWAIGEYLGRVGVGSAYGAAGSLVVLLVWVYYSAVIVFAGAEFTQVYAVRRGAGIVPARYAKLSNGHAPRQARHASQDA